MLRTYNLISAKNFPTIITKTTAISIDSAFIDSSRDCDLKPYVSGLSDHDAQLAVIKNGTVTKEKCKCIDIEEINKDTISEFQTILSWESWEDIFTQGNVNNVFNNFHNAFLRCFYANFPKKRKRFKGNQGKWITNGIKILCKKKDRVNFII
jgi:hypothetical protein